MYIITHNMSINELIISELSQLAKTEGSSGNPFKKYLHIVMPSKQLRIYPLKFQMVRRL